MLVVAVVLFICLLIYFEIAVIRTVLYVYSFPDSIQYMCTDVFILHSNDIQSFQ